MIFWTIMFLLFTIHTFTTGGLGKKVSRLAREVGELQVRLNNNEEVDKDKMTTASLKLVFAGLFAIVYAVAFIIYLSVGMTIPDTKIISLVMLVIYLVAVGANISKSRKTNYDLKTEEGRVNYFKSTDRKRTFKNICLQLLYVVYFAAMLILLVM